jgi:hypothetical protein
MASTSKAECTDAVETFEMHTDLAHRRESMYGYKTAAGTSFQHQIKIDLANWAVSI